MAENNSLLGLKIMDVLRKHSDKDNPLTQQDIVRLLKSDFGTEVDRKTVGRNIAVLVDYDDDRHIGYKTSKRMQNGEESERRTAFYYKSDFEAGEMRVLIDSILSNRHISMKYTKDLIDKIVEKNEWLRKKGIRDIAFYDTYYKQNIPDLFLNTEEILFAIDEHHDLEITVGDYDVNLNLTGGRPTRVSPIQLCMYEQIICFPRECTKSKAIFLERLPDIGFVEVEEELLRGERTKNYLKMLAKEAGARADKKLYEKVSLEKQYLPTELKKIFHRWYSRKMRETVYPQYAHIKETGYEAAKNQPKGSAYQELDSMIGLTEAKAVIKRATSFFKSRKLFAEKGMKEEHPSMHMVFSGNPGTAKTSTARLFAEIMREEGILSRGHLLEVGRSDLVGKFVGWTAKIVRQKFKEAEGGVLFIDEAYSLVDDRNGSYGDEAINTIVQEMENHRENVVVIFAGYPDKMQEFLDKNPGLRSRIAFHVPFADYSDDELCEIARFLARKKGLTLTEDACERLRTVFTTERRKPDFGNGRIVRNVLEKAQMVQAERLMAMDYDSVTKEDITTITGADIELPEAPKNQRKALGFSVA